VIVILSLAVAVLFGTGAYLVLKHDLIRVAVGMVLISNAANLFIMSAGLIRGAPPIYPLSDAERVSDPLVQGMTLTAIVIGLGVTALLLTLVHRVYTSHLSLDLDDLAAAEEREEAALEAAREREATGLGQERDLVAIDGRTREAD
jgi:multicomponent Na+:H+ antiporter subunit C